MLACIYCYKFVLFPVKLMCTGCLIPHLDGRQLTVYTIYYVLYIIVSDYI